MDQTVILTGKFRPVTSDDLLSIKYAINFYKCSDEIPLHIVVREGTDKSLFNGKLAAWMLQESLPENLRGKAVIRTANVQLMKPEIIADGANEQSQLDAEMAKQLTADHIMRQLGLPPGAGIVMTLWDIREMRGLPARPQRVYQPIAVKGDSYLVSEKRMAKFKRPNVLRELTTRERIIGALNGPLSTHATDLELDRFVPPVVRDVVVMARQYLHHMRSRVIDTGITGSANIITGVDRLPMRDAMLQAAYNFGMPRPPLPQAEPATAKPPEPGWFLWRAKSGVTATAA